MAYSHSKLKVYEECALRFRYKYIDKIPEPQVPAKPALFFGTIVHAALEVLYKKIQNSWSAPTRESLKQFVQEEMIKARDEHDRLSDTALLPDQFTDYLDLGRQMIDRYYDTYEPFTTGKVNGLEKMFNFELPNTQKLTGVIDRFDIDGDVATIVDYKTDKDIKPYGEFSLSHEQQMTSYAAWIMVNYPHVVKTIRGKLIYLRLGREIERDITPEAIEQAIQIITDKISVIEEVLFRYNMGEKEAFWPSEWPQCRRCAYQVMCPLWKHKFQADEAVVVSEIGETTIKKLVDKFATLTAEKKRIEENLQWLKEFLEEYVSSHSDEWWKKLYGEWSTLDIRYTDEYKTRDEESSQQLKDYLVQEWMFDYLTMMINTNKLTKSLDTDPSLKEKFSSWLERREKYTVGWVKEKK